jgi:hypothetical protein
MVATAATANIRAIDILESPWSLIKLGFQGVKHRSRGIIPNLWPIRGTPRFVGELFPIYGLFVARHVFGHFL